MTWLRPARRHAGLLQRSGGRSRGLDRQRQQQALDRDEAIAGLLGGLFGSRKDACASGCAKIDAAVAAGNLRQLGKRRIIGEPRGLGIAAGALDQRCGHALIVIEQNFQHVFGA